MRLAPFLAAMLVLAALATDGAQAGDGPVIVVPGPYTDAELGEWAERIAASDAPVYAYFRHEEEPTAPRYAQRLLELLV